MQIVDKVRAVGQGCCIHVPSMMNIIPTSASLPPHCVTGYSRTTLLIWTGPRRSIEMTGFQNATHLTEGQKKSKPCDSSVPVPQKLSESMLLLRHTGTVTPRVYVSLQNLSIRNAFNHSFRCLGKLYRSQSSCFSIRCHGNGQ